MRPLREIGAHGSVCVCVRDKLMRDVFRSFFSPGFSLIVYLHILILSLVKIYMCIYVCILYLLLYIRGKKEISWINMTVFTTERILVWRQHNFCFLWVLKLAYEERDIVFPPIKTHSDVSLSR